MALMTRATEAGNVVAMQGLGTLFMRGKGAPMDFFRGLDLIKRFLLAQKERVSREYEESSSLSGVSAAIIAFSGGDETHGSTLFDDSSLSEDDELNEIEIDPGGTVDRTLLRKASRKALRVNSHG